MFRNEKCSLLLLTRYFCMITKILYYYNRLLYACSKDVMIFHTSMPLVCSRCRVTATPSLRSPPDDAVGRDRVPSFLPSPPLRRRFTGAWHWRVVRWVTLVRTRLPHSRRAPPTFVVICIFGTGRRRFAGLIDRRPGSD